MDMADKAVLYSCLCFFREFGEVGAAKPDVVRLSEEASAASRRLCVETDVLAQYKYRYVTWESLRQTAESTANRRSEDSNYGRYAAPGRNFSLALEMKF